MVSRPHYTRPTISRRFAANPSLRWWALRSRSGGTLIDYAEEGVSGGKIEDEVDAETCSSSMCEFACSPPMFTRYVFLPVTLVDIKVLIEWKITASSLVI
jgi:hypothetical protein